MHCEHWAAANLLLLPKTAPCLILPTLLTEQLYWVYWSTWWGFEGSGKGNIDALYSKNYGLAAVITQDEVSISTALAPLPIQNRESAFSLQTPQNSERFALYTLTGRRIAPQGISALGLVPAGTYVVREIVNGSHEQKKRHTIH
jgi:hypothetical protein